MTEEDTPKLYMDKPNKAQRKRKASFTMAPSLSTASRPPPSTNRPLKEPFARRYKFLWPMLLAVNFSIGACLLLMPKKREGVLENLEASQASSASMVDADARISPGSEK
ncbi:unnamed protein product [Cuscuta epithymum]|uniref:Uncharacterized protein n=1 Tax=Cuscuta epithymum TaxID=186058 RepID=A0AAV0GCI7_9ASTE|nr:unnamed protein product [Cuscuta epithymum]